jgi:hypothetical protein
MSTKPDDELIRLFQRGVHEDIALLDEKLSVITAALKQHYTPDGELVKSTMQTIAETQQDLAEITVVLKSYVP